MYHGFSYMHIILFLNCKHNLNCKYITYPKQKFHTSPFPSGWTFRKTQEILKMPNGFSFLLGSYKSGSFVQFTPNLFLSNPTFHTHLAILVLMCRMCER